MFSAGDLYLRGGLEKDLCTEDILHPWRCKECGMDILCSFSFIPPSSHSKCQFQYDVIVIKSKNVYNIFHSAAAVLKCFSAVGKT